MITEKDYEGLARFATPKQLGYLAEKSAGKTDRQIAKNFGVSHQTVSEAIRAVKAKAAKHGYSPDYDVNHPTPPGYMVKGVSTLYRDEEQVLQWVKTSADAERMHEMMLEALKALNDEIIKVKPVKVPSYSNGDLLNLSVITDYHLGALAWAEECGDDWDTAIAEKLLVNWFKKALDLSPPAAIGVLAQLGDFLHFDGLEALTPENKNVLDADTRFQLVVRTSIRVLKTVIAMMLEKYKRVHVIMAEGNHDPASSIWLREMFHTLYENEPRITVDLSPDPYYCVEHGKTSLFFHHGHKRKIASISKVFAGKFRETFGRTKHSYAHMGHYHCIDVKEDQMMVIEQHRTLAAPDAYAVRGGWLSGREASVITYHKEYGQVSKITINADLVK